jgi:hypothetical protein
MQLMLMMVKQLTVAGSGASAAVALPAAQVNIRHSLPP